MSNKPVVKQKKMKVVGTQQYANPYTGELEEFQVIRMEDRDFNFEKIWLAHILEALEAVGNKKIKVLNTLLELKNSDNLIIAKQDDIALRASVSRPVVNETINILVEANFIKKVQNGVYQINPEVMFKGNNQKRMRILLDYTKDGSTTKETKVADNPEQFLLTDTTIGDQIPAGTTAEDWVEIDG